MIEWGGGPLPFKADYLTTWVDSRGCIYYFFLDGDSLFLSLRGSKPPYPFSTPDKLGDGFKNSGSSFDWIDKNLVFAWPKIVGKALQLYIDPMKYDDPSEGGALTKYPENHIGWIGLLPWMMNNPSADIDGMFKRTSDAGISCVRSFCWVGSPDKSNRYTFKCLPWKLVETYRVDFNQPDSKFDKQFKKLAKYCLKYDMDFMPILFMDRYNDHIFSLAGNINGVANKYDDNAKVFILAYVERCLNMLREVYGQAYRPFAQPINEAAHYGRNDIAHKVADFSQMVGDKILEYTNYGHMIPDASESDFNIAQYVGRYNSDGTKHLCPLCPEGHERWFGRDEFASRPVIPEQHGCSTLEGFYSNGFDAWLGSAWPELWTNEDGSFSGSIEVILNGRVLFRQANVTELNESLQHVLNESHLAGKRFGWCCFPFEVLEVKTVGGEEVLMENFWRWPEFNWPRIRVYSKVRMEIGG